MKTPINEKEIETYCYNLYQLYLSYDNYYSTAYDLLYNCGCRYIEAFDLLRWSFISKDLCLLLTAKHNNNREIEMKNVTISSKEDIKHNENKYTMCNYKSMYNNHISNLLDGQLYYEEKHVCFHIFRHNYFKKLWQTGVTMAEMQRITGEKSEANVFKYVNSVIYKIE